MRTVHTNHARTLDTDSRKEMSHQGKAQSPRRLAAITQAQKAQVIERLEQGATLNKAAETAHTTASEIWAECERDHVFSDSLARARLLGWQQRADELDDVCLDERIGVDRAKLLIDTRKWFLSRVFPALYGDKVSVEHTHKSSEHAMTDAELMSIARRAQLRIEASTATDVDNEQVAALEQALAEPPGGGCVRTPGVGD